MKKSLGCVCVKLVKFVLLHAICSGANQNCDQEEMVTNDLVFQFILLNTHLSLNVEAIP